MSDMSFIQKWGGVMLVTAVFIVMMIIYSVVGNVGLGDYGALTYMAPISAGLLAWLMWKVNKKKSK